MKRKTTEPFSDVIIGLILLGLGVLIVTLGHSLILLVIIGAIIAIIGLFILGVIP